MVFFIASCARVSKIPSDTLVIGIENEIKNLDLRFAADANSVHVAKLVFQSLVRTGDDLRPEYDLVENVEIKNDQIFKFKIPQDVYFHDGVKLTAQDVLYNFLQASGPKSKIKSSFEDVEEFLAPDDRTFIIRLKKPRPSFLASDVSAIRIFPKHLGESPSVSLHPIGSGPYQFVVRKSRDLHFSLWEKYKTFAQSSPAHLPTFKKIIVRSIEDPTTRFFSLIGGDIDVLINALSPRRVRETVNEVQLQTLRSPGTNYQYLGLNLKNPKFSDSRVRLALSLAINRNEIIQHKLKGFAVPARSLLSPQNVFANPHLEAHQHNLEKAKSLLKEAGVENLEVEIRSSADRDTISMLQVIQEQWRQIGVNSRLKSTEFADFFSAVQNGQFEVFSLRWTAVSEPDLLNRVFHSRETPPGRNRVFYKNADVDRWLDAAASETNFTRRQAFYFKAQEKIASDLPYISLWYPDNVAVVQSSIKNFKLSPTASWTGLFYAYKTDNHGR